MTRSRNNLTVRDRRSFLRTSIAGLAGLASISASGRAKAANNPLDQLRFVSPEPAVAKLAEDVFRQCVIAKEMPPEGSLKHRWMQAGTGNAFYGQWIWDTMFIIDLLAFLPDSTATIREIFQNYWDFQQRWNGKMPEYAHDMIPCMIEPNNANWLKYPAYSQIPILAWGMERVHRRNRDDLMLRNGITPLERFHEWYWRERDITNSGLIAVGSYSGDIQHARWETFDYECNLDDLKLTAHPKRKHPAGEGPWYGNILAAGNTAYLILAERCLRRLAILAGDEEMAGRRQARIDMAVKAMREHMWHEESGCFLSVRRDTLEKIPVATIGSWIALHAEVPTKEMAARMAETMQTDHWNTPLPVPTVDRKSPLWRPDSYWRGDVWPATNYQIADGFSRCGHPDAAASIADKTVENAMKNGISEHYNSVTGKPLGVPYLGMTCTIVTMMLDGLCRKHSLKIERA